MRKRRDGNPKEPWRLPVSRAELAFATGLAVALIGVWWIFPAAALVLGGLSLCAVALKLGVSK